MANVFPKWANTVPLKLIVGLVILAGTTAVAVGYYYNPRYTRVGYMPTQPVSFSHYLHAEQIGIDCRYCHSYVDQSGHSNVPDSGTCMNCHNAIKNNSPLLAAVRASYSSGDPVPWVRIHKVPDYVYFNHAVHVNRGISCVECHGKINEMEVVYHSESLGMGFCLDCHRNPERFIRPQEEVYNLNWEPASDAEQAEMGAFLVNHLKVNPPQSCSGCHR